MSMEKQPRNPIEQRKASVRKHTRNGAIYVGAGVIGGLGLFALSGGWFWLLLGMVIAVAGGVSSYRKVNRIINHRDEY